MRAPFGPLGPMLTVVTFLWTTPGYRSKFTPEHVRTMARMVERNYHGQAVRLVCFNDIGMHGEDWSQRGVDWRPLWGDYADIPNPHGAHNPSCYRRLKLWSDWGRDTVGKRILQIDLDMVICGDVTPIWDRPEPCVMWSDALNKTTPYNGAMQLFSPGGDLGRAVWEGFDPANSPAKARARGYFGSDQAWLSLALGQDRPRWTMADGCLSWRLHAEPYAGRHDGACPPGARVVNFHGLHDPWTLTDRVAWIKEHYR